MTSPNGLEEGMSEGPGEPDLVGAIESHLARIVDPGAGLDVLRMRLVRDLKIDEAGRVNFTFKPSSPVCPMAFSLVPAIKEAVESVPGVSRVEVRVENFNRARELEALVNEENDG
jgi:metal-sulfur cluster biosynthetic enzyme